MFEELDELARGQAENDISRRQAIRWAGYSVLGASLSSMGFAESAEALTRKARRRCRRKGGTPLEKGTCHCAGNCPGGAFFNCGNNPDCFCLETTEGKGFCANANLVCSATCTSSNQCPSGQKCVVRTCCTLPVCAAACSG